MPCPREKITDHFIREWGTLVESAIPFDSSEFGHFVDGLQGLVPALEAKIAEGLPDDAVEGFSFFIIGWVEGSLKKSSRLISAAN